MWNMCIRGVYTCIGGVWITCATEQNTTHVLHVYDDMIHTLLPPSFFSPGGGSRVSIDAFVWQ